MEIKEFWVVTKPTVVSQLLDICWKSTPWSINLQFFGGLKANDIIGFWTEEKEAKRIARDLLDSEWQKKMSPP